MKLKPKVLFIDNQELTNIGLTSHYQQNGLVDLIGHVDDIDMLAQAVLTSQADILLIGLDVKKPETNSEVMDVCKVLLKANKKLKIVLYSQLNAYAINIGRQIGIKGFIKKDEYIRVLDEALISVYEGKAYLSEGCKEVLAKNAEIMDPEQVLTKRQFEIFLRVAKGQSMEDAAKDMNVTYRAVAVALVKIRDKLGVDTNYDLIRIAVRKSLVEIA